MPTAPRGRRLLGPNLMLVRSGGVDMRTPRIKLFALAGGDGVPFVGKTPVDLGDVAGGPHGPGFATAMVVVRLAKMPGPTPATDPPDDP